MKRLKWLGHIESTDHQRIPKQLLCGESEMGKRKFGRLTLRFMDQIKNVKKKVDIGINS